MHSSNALSPTEPPQTGQYHESGRRGRSSKSRKHPRRRFLLGGATVLGLAATGTSAWALNRFVIDHVEVGDVAALEAKAQNAAANSSATPATNVTVGENSYSSSNTSIEIQQVSTGSGNDTVTYYVADVKLTNATDLRSAFANNSYGTNIVAKPSAMASEHDAILAINGDYYGFRSDGILIRNGVIYRDSGTRDGMAFYTDGRVEVYDETTTKAQTLLDAGVWNTLSFGPALVNGSRSRWTRTSATTPSRASSRAPPWGGWRRTTSSSSSSTAAARATRAA